MQLQRGDILKTRTFDLRRPPSTLVSLCALWMATLSVLSVLRVAFLLVGETSDISMVKLSLLWWDVLPSRQKLLLPFKTSYWTALVGICQSFCSSQRWNWAKEGDLELAKFRKSSKSDIFSQDDVFPSLCRGWCSRALGWGCYWLQHRSRCYHRCTLRFYIVTLWHCYIVTLQIHIAGTLPYIV